MIKVDERDMAQAFYSIVTPVPLQDLDLRPTACVKPLLTLLKRAMVEDGLVGAVCKTVFCVFSRFDLPAHRHRGQTIPDQM
jgi:hypothetical protein